ncbi:MAG: T9SS type A sorting domain-containing protein [Bacteroidales bacterium]|nr:T9SS type A sorting domain-containing protein [Bacteroidales bacterium]
MKKKPTLAFCLLFLVLFNSIKAQDWEQSNGPNGGAISGLTISGNSTYASIGSTLYYKEAGGIFRTDDNGLNWVSVNNGLLNTNIKTVYAKDTVLFAGAIAGYDAADAGVFRSFNEGQTWESCGLTSQTITCLIHQGDYIFAGTQTGGVYRSSDNGNTWVAKNSGLPTGGVQDFAKNNSYIFVVRGSSVLRSANFGDTWIAINTGLPTSGPFKSVVTIASNGDTLYAGTSNLTSLLDGVYRSVNSGSNWTLTGLSNTAITELFTLENDVYAAIPAVGVRKSSDLGVTWTMTSLPIGQNYCFIANTGNIFSGNGNLGVFRSTDDGINWNLVDNGMRGQCIRTLGASSNTIFAGTELCGVFKTNDNGQNWVAVNNGINNNTKTIQTLDVFDSNLFINAYGGGTLTAYRSNDNGENWTAVDLVDPPQSYAAMGDTIFCSSYVAHSYDDTLQLYRSNNKGVTWELLQGLGLGIQQTAILKTIGNTLLLFTNNNVYQSSDYGTSWVAIGSVSGVSRVTLCNSVLFCSTTNGIYKSIDFGYTWQYANLMISAAHLVSNNNKVFAELDRDIYVTVNYGDTWVEISNETIASTSIFPYVYGYALVATNNDIYSSVGHRSLYKRELSDFSAPLQPDAISGSATPCIGSSQTYSVTNVQGVTYTWQFPSGWVITAGGTTNSVTVTAGNVPGIVLVTPSNVWGAGPAQFLIVTPNSNPPDQPGVIEGPVNPLEGTSLIYSVVNDPGVSYAWTFPSGWVQTAGGTTNEVTVTIGSGSGDITVTPSTPCGTGVPRTLAVVTVPANLTVSNIIIPDGQINCYNATGTIVVAGGESTFLVQSGGEATFIAGQAIYFMPGTTVEEGGYLLGVITTTGQYCNSLPAKMMAASGTETLHESKQVSLCRLYPNPATGSFTLEFTDNETTGLTKIEIYSISGLKVFTKECNGVRKQSVSVSDLRPGVYFIHVTTGGGREALKLIKL